MRTKLSFEIDDNSLRIDLSYNNKSITSVISKDDMLKLKNLGINSNMIMSKLINKISCSIDEKSSIIFKSDCEKIIKFINK